MSTFSNEKKKMSACYQAMHDPAWTVGIHAMGQKGDIADIFAHFHDDVFLESVKAWQKKNGLIDDGIFGRKCLEFKGYDVMNRIPTVSLYTTAIRVCGEFIDVGFKIMHDRDMQFGTHPSTFNVRQGEPKMVVWHWDVCISSVGCFQTLLERNLSIHFMIDADGTIYQTLDLGLQADHTKGFDSQSIGIEINNPYWVKKADKLEIKRPLVEEYLPNNNGVQEHLGFTAEQEKSAVLLASALSDILDIPKVLPAGQHPSMRDQSGVSTRAHIKSGHMFNGHVGHYHLQPDKMDPGTLLWPAFLRSGFKAVEPSFKVEAE